MLKALFSIELRQGVGQVFNPCFGLAKYCPAFFALVEFIFCFCQDMGDQRAEQGEQVADANRCVNIQHETIKFQPQLWLGRDFHNVYHPNCGCDEEQKRGDTPENNDIFDGYLHLAPVLNQDQPSQDWAPADQELHQGLQVVEVARLTAEHVLRLDPPGRLVALAHLRPDAHGEQWAGGWRSLRVRIGQ